MRPVNLCRNHPQRSLCCPCRVVKLIAIFNFSLLLIADLHRCISSAPAVFLSTVSDKLLWRTDTVAAAMGPARAWGCGASTMECLVWVALRITKSSEMCLHSLSKWFCRIAYMKSQDKYITFCTRLLIWYIRRSPSQTFGRDVVSNLRRNWGGRNAAHIGIHDRLTTWLKSIAKEPDMKGIWSAGNRRGSLRFATIGHTHLAAESPLFHLSLSREFVEI